MQAGNGYRELLMFGPLCERFQGDSGGHDTELLFIAISNRLALCAICACVFSDKNTEIRLERMLPLRCALNPRWLCPPLTVGRCCGIEISFAGGKDTWRLFFRSTKLCYPCALNASLSGVKLPRKTRLHLRAFRSGSSLWLFVNLARKSPFLKGLVDVGHGFF